MEYTPESDPVVDAQAAQAEAQGEPGTVPAEKQVIGALGTPRAYLERVTLVSDADAVDPSQAPRTLMTLHAAKGLEFPVVAMVGLEEGVLPHSRVNENPSELEEERRLCFVGGITRAMRRTSVDQRHVWTIRGVSERTMESRFLAELPKENITLSDQSGAAGAGLGRR